MLVVLWNRRIDCCLFYPHPRLRCSLRYCFAVWCGIMIGSTYDEFRSFVACSQLKPILQKELSQLIKPPSSWTTYANGNPSGINRVAKYSKNDNSCREIGKHDNCTNHKLKSSTVQLDPSTNDANQGKSKTRQISLQDFEKQWKRCVHTQLKHGEDGNLEAKARFLKSNIVTPRRFGKMYANRALDPIMLGEIIQVLHHLTNRISTHICKIRETTDFSSDKEAAVGGETVAEEACFVLEWMKVLPECDRFALNLSFLDSSQKVIIRKIFGLLDSSECRHDDEERDNCVLDEINHLRGVYQITK